MTTRSEIVAMISCVWEKFVQKMVRTVQYVREEVVAHVSSQLDMDWVHPRVGLTWVSKT